VGYKEFQPAIFEDWLSAFPKGVNSGVAPLLLPKDQLFTALNTSVRGTYVRPRPPYKKITLSDPSALLASMLSDGPYQGGCYFQPENLDEALVISVGGRIAELTIVGDTATVTERSIPGDLNPTTLTQAWLWQAEKWVIVNDGVSLPLFIDESTTVRSNWNIPTTASTTTTTALTIPAVGGTGSVDFASVAGLTSGVVFTVQDKGTYIVNSIAGTTVSFTSISGSPIGQVVPSGAVVTWQIVGRQLPPGRMGTYGLGRNWVCLADGKQFVGSDLVGGSSGTLADNFRDAVLNITENNYLLGGGYFTVPGSLGDITFMLFTSTLDVSLGQGPLQVGTYKSIFSCQAPVDRTTWSDVVNPILTQSLISRGGLGQNSTINANNDIIMRSLNGILSLILARREFQTWGNVPISREVESTLAKDSPDLLPWGSAVTFDNRLLMTSRPVLHEKGIYHTALIPLNFDPVSTLGGKAPSVYDSTMWTGLNVLQIFTGDFSQLDRCFAITLKLNGTIPELELWEVLKSSTDEYLDDGTDRITWSFESPILFNQTAVSERAYLRLLDGEIFVDQLKGLVDFQVYYKPDQYPCWIPWFSWQECARQSEDTSKPQYRPQMGLGQPDGRVCNEDTGMPMREGWGFQIKVVITGQCRFLGARVQANTVPDPAFAKQTCEVQCNPTYTPLGPPVYCNTAKKSTVECSEGIEYTFTVREGTYCSDTQAEADVLAKEAAALETSPANRLCLTSRVPDSFCNGEEGSYTLSVTGGNEPFTWTVPTGSLPDGLRLSATTGRTISLTGTPFVDGSYTFTIAVSNSTGGVLTFTKTVTVAVCP
jgi:hypothetical protein